MRLSRHEQWGSPLQQVIVWRRRVVRLPECADLLGGRGRFADGASDGAGSVRAGGGIVSPLCTPGAIAIRSVELANRSQGFYRVGNRTFGSGDRH